MSTTPKLDHMLTKLESRNYRISLYADTLREIATEFAAVVRQRDAALARIRELETQAGES